MTTPPAWSAACASFRVREEVLRSVARVNVDILPGEIAGPIQTLGFSLMDANLQKLTGALSIFGHLFGEFDTDLVQGVSKHLAFSGGSARHARSTVGQEKHAVVR